jgi:dGTPase
LNRFFGDAGIRRARVVCDYIAGMTDRYAAAEHQRLFDETPELHLSPPEAHDPIRPLPAPT